MAAEGLTEAPFKSSDRSDDQCFHKLIQCDQPVSLSQELKQVRLLTSKSGPGCFGIAIKRKHGDLAASQRSYQSSTLFVSLFVESKLEKWRQMLLVSPRETLAFISQHWVFQLGRTTFRSWKLFRNWTIPLPAAEVIFLWLSTVCVINNDDLMNLDMY